jgi:phospholipid N-methyltransferase
MLAFVAALARRPHAVASVMPSGEALARLITSEVPQGRGRVLELGPGTGVFTRALLGRGVRESDLTLVERDPNLAALLRGKFPQASIVTGDVARLNWFSDLGPGVYRSTVSGLPLLSMTDPAVRSILAGVFQRMLPGASLFQFTYGPACPIRPLLLIELGLVARRIGWTIRNMPPASVYRIECERY